jgi:hypothetical protein
LNNAGNIANTQVANQQAATGAVTTANQNEQQNLLNSIAQQNNAAVGNQSNVNNTNASLAGGVSSGQQQLLGSMTGALGSSLGLANGGVVKQAYADGGDVVQVTDPLAVQAPMAPVAPSVPQGPQSSVGKFFHSLSQPQQSSQPSGMNQVGSNIGKGLGSALSSMFSSAPASNNQQSVVPTSEQNAAVMGAPGTTDASGMPTAQATGDILAAMPNQPMAEGGKVPALVSPGEQYLPPEEAKEVVKKGKNPLSLGERIPGIPKYPGNDYRNDTVPKTLKEGGVVIPNEIMQSKNAAEKAKKFVEAHLAQKGGYKGKK